MIEAKTEAAALGRALFLKWRNFEQKLERVYTPARMMENHKRLEEWMDAGLVSNDTLEELKTQDQINLERADTEQEPRQENIDKTNPFLNESDDGSQPKEN